MEVNEQIIDLYHEDRRCAFLKRRIEEIPAALARLREDALSRSDVESKRQEELEDLEKSIRGVDRELKAKQALLPEKMKKRQKAVTVEEMRASDRELETVEQAISHLEDRLLGKMESLEILQRESQIREPSEREGMAALAREADELDSELAECRHELEKSEGQRARLISTLDKLVARRYERVFGSHGHTTLAPLLSGACGGCGETLTAQLAIEVAEKRKLEPCEGCGRLVLRADR